MEQLTTQNFQDKIKAGKIIIDVWAPWCGPCKMFAPIFEASAKDHPDITFAKLNSDEEGMVAQQLGIRGIPTMVFFADGAEVGRVSGAMPRPMFEAKIREIFG